MRSICTLENFVLFFITWEFKFVCMTIFFSIIATAGAIIVAVCLSYCLKICIQFYLYFDWCSLCVLASDLWHYYSIMNCMRVERYAARKYALRTSHISLHMHIKQFGECSLFFHPGQRIYSTSAALSHCHHIYSYSKTANLDYLHMGPYYKNRQNIDIYYGMIKL